MCLMKQTETEVLQNAAENHMEKIPIHSDGNYTQLFLCRTQRSYYSCILLFSAKSVQLAEAR